MYAVAGSEGLDAVALGQAAHIPGDVHGPHQDGVQLALLQGAHADFKCPNPGGGSG